MLPLNGHRANPSQLLYNMSAKSTTLPQRFLNSKSSTMTLISALFFVFIAAPTAAYLLTSAGEFRSSSTFA